MGNLNNSRLRRANLVGRCTSTKFAVDASQRQDDSPDPDATIEALQTCLRYGDVFSPQQLCSRGLWTWGSLPSAVRRIVGLSFGAKVTYAALAEFEATMERVFPSVKRIGAEIGVGADQARRYIHELEEAKLLKVSPRRMQENEKLHDSSVYEFLYHPAFDSCVKGTGTPKAEGTCISAGTRRTEGTGQSMGTPECAGTLEHPVGVLADLQGGYPPVRESSKTNEEHQLTTPLRKAAERIHKTHPAVRRDLGLPKIEERLKAIAKRRKLHGSQANSYFAAIATYHEQLCQSEQWQKEDGQFAKGLSNWLAPALDRYDPGSAQPNTAPQETLPPKLPMGASKYDDYDPNAEYAAYQKAAGLDS